MYTRSCENTVESQLFLLCRGIREVCLVQGIVKGKTRIQSNWAFSMIN